MLKTFFITVLTLFVFPQVGWGEIYVVDPAHTHIGFSVKHLVISNVKGKFNTFSGWVETDGKGGIVKAFFEIESASIDTGHVKRDKHLRSSDFLDVEKYPSLIFKYKETKARNGNHYVIVGDLSLHGVTKSVTLNMELLGKVKIPGEISGPVSQVQPKLIVKTSVSSGTSCLKPAGCLSAMW